jgi:hypothetical protein
MTVGSLLSVSNSAHPVYSGGFIMQRLSSLAQHILFLRSALTHARGDDRRTIAVELSDLEMAFDLLYHQLLP